MPAPVPTPVNIKVLKSSFLYFADGQRGIDGNAENYH